LQGSLVHGLDAFLILGLFVMAPLLFFGHLLLCHQCFLLQVLVIRVVSIVLFIVPFKVFFIGHMSMASGTIRGSTIGPFVGSPLRRRPSNLLIATFLLAAAAAWSFLKVHVRAPEPEDFLQGT